MYIQTCKGGYPNPIGALCRGKEVLGFRATVNTPSASSRVMLWDDTTLKDSTQTVGNNVTTDYFPANGTKFVDAKGVADVDANIDVLFPEPIKLRSGLSYACDNILAGSMMLYVK